MAPKGVLGESADSTPSRPCADPTLSREVSSAPSTAGSPPVACAFSPQPGSPWTRLRGFEVPRCPPHGGGVCLGGLLYCTRGAGSGPTQFTRAADHTA